MSATSLEEQYQAVLAENAALQEQLTHLQQQLAWFKRQLFGPTSERRVVDANRSTLDLFGRATAPREEGPNEEITYKRRKPGIKDRAGAVTDEGLRFDETVPVEIVELPAPQLDGSGAEDWEIISFKETHRLAQRPGSYVVIRYRRPVLRRKDRTEVITTAAPSNVLEGSLADVSFLAGMLVDKFCYHQPLYRQHQRLGDSGIRLSRATLTNLANRAIDLLQPIAQAQHDHILQSRVLAMDETPIKAGRNKEKKRMQQAWFWPLYGDANEISFTFSPHRAARHIHEHLVGFSGTLISDGYSAYTSFTKAAAGIAHAQCWAHTRRTFIEAEDSEPDEAARALEYIRGLYRIEEAIRDRRLEPDKALQERATHSKPIVDAFFAWCYEQRQRAELLPSNPLSKALAYAHEREEPLRVFLGDPAVPIDTNHLERALRVIPMGKKNWLFAWTEVGARHIATIQSLLATCRLQGVPPYTYLVDVLQRISRHPAKDVIALTPRVWKERFSDRPLRCVLTSA